MPTIGNGDLPDGPEGPSTRGDSGVATSGWRLEGRRSWDLLPELPPRIDTGILDEREPDVETRTLVSNTGQMMVSGEDFLLRRPWVWSAARERNDRTRP